MPATPRFIEPPQSKMAKYLKRTDNNTYLFCYPLNNFETITKPINTTNRLLAEQCAEAILLDIELMLSTRNYS
jgi:hypothetical protein